MKPHKSLLTARWGLIYGQFNVFTAFCFSFWVWKSFGTTQNSEDFYSALPQSSSPRGSSMCICTLAPAWWLPHTNINIFQFNYRSLPRHASSNLNISETLKASTLVGEGDRVELMQLREIGRHKFSKKSYIVHWKM